MTNVLRSSGVLGKIKAQLRSSVYLALDEGKEVRVREAVSGYPGQNQSALVETEIEIIKL